MPRNNKKSSARMAFQAAEILKDPNSSKIQKSLAGSVLSQTGTANQTGVDMENKASEILQSNKYSETTKSLAGSVLSQSNKDR